MPVQGMEADIRAHERNRMKFYIDIGPTPNIGIEYVCCGCYKHQRITIIILLLEFQLKSCCLIGKINDKKASALLAIFFQIHK